MTARAAAAAAHGDDDDTHKAVTLSADQEALFRRRYLHADANAGARGLGMGVEGSLLSLGQSIDTPMGMGASIVSASASASASASFAGTESMPGTTRTAAFGASVGIGSGIVGSGAGGGHIDRVPTSTSRSLSRSTQRLIRQHLADKAEREDASAAFDLYDSDGSGTINRKELQTLLRRCGVMLSRRQLLEVMDMLAVRRSGSGHIEREEFIEWWMAQGKLLVDGGVDKAAKGKKEKEEDEEWQRERQRELVMAQPHQHQPHPPRRLNSNSVVSTKGRGKGKKGRGRGRSARKAKSETKGQGKGKGVQNAAVEPSVTARARAREQVWLDAQEALIASAHDHAIEKRTERANELLRMQQQAQAAAEARFAATAAAQ